MVCIATGILCTTSITLFILLKNIRRRQSPEPESAFQEPVNEMQHHAIENINRFILKTIGDLAADDLNTANILEIPGKRIRYEGMDVPEFLSDIQTAADFSCCGIITHLRSSYPELTFDELSVCALTCLGFPSGISRQLMQMSNPASFYNMRSRIRHKIKCTDSDTTLDRQLKSIVEELKKNSFISK